MARPAARKALDTNRAGAAFGGDQRIWVGIGIVSKAPTLDPVNGLFATVILQPENIPVTARVACAYSGPEFGVWLPLRKDEQVVVMFPRGDTFDSPIIVGRVPSQDEKPPSEFDNQTVIIKGKSGENVKVITQGSDQVYLADPAGPYSAVRYQPMSQALAALLNQILAHTHLGGTLAGGFTGTFNPALPILPFNPPSAQWESQDVRVK